MTDNIMNTKVLILKALCGTLYALKGCTRIAGYYNKVRKYHIRGLGTKPSCVRILVELRMTNGLHISQKNLNYQELKQLIEKLEGLCLM